MFISLASPKEMHDWDSQSIDLGIPPALLMENASREAWHVLYTIFTRGDVQGIIGKRFLFLMGAGNNGGDAAALARHMHNAGAHVLVVHTRPLETYGAMASEHIMLSQACGVPFMPVEIWLERIRHKQGLFFMENDDLAYVPHGIIDGLLGTGFHGALRGLELDIIEYLTQWLSLQANDQAQPPYCGLFDPLSLPNVSFCSQNTWADKASPLIVALDIPSGLDGITGKPCPLAIKADITITFEAPKLGLITLDARPYVGEVIVRPIGIPACIQRDAPTQCKLMRNNPHAILPSMDKLGHKGDAGHVLLIGGSLGLTGAIHLAAKAAFRTGAGLVSLACPAGLAQEAKGGSADIMTLGVGADNLCTWPALNAQHAENIQPLLDFATRAKAIVLGPGIGRSPEAKAIVEAVLALPSRPPIIIDADALFFLSYTDGIKNPLLHYIQEQDILTPHPTEAARILGKSTGEVQANRMQSLKELMAILRGTMVLKGACTLIGFAKDGKITVSPYSEPHLSVAGSGDVLAGIAASLVAQGLSGEQAAPLAVLLHAKAGALVAQDFSKRGNMASDIIKRLPQTLV